MAAGKGVTTFPESRFSKFGSRAWIIRHVYFVHSTPRGKEGVEFVRLRVGGFDLNFFILLGRLEEEGGGRGGSF